MRAKYAEFGDIVDYLKAFQEDLFEHLEVFRESSPSGQSEGPRVPEGRYAVNVLVTNGVHPGAPIVFEPNPTYYNLMGRIDFRSGPGVMATDLTMIKPGALALSASLAFEQSYAGVDGDSASAAELCALLSALAEIPIHQRIAMTGSINQRGEIQAVGGVTRKIQGFFDVCKDRGLDGTHGVIIPAANVRHLVLRPEVVEAVEQGLFHVWAIRSVDEALELLTGVHAGLPDGEALYPATTIHGRVQRRLEGMAADLSKFSGFGDHSRPALSGNGVQLPPVGIN